ncbi:helix-turn-helix domain-containing protein [Eggerthella sinensis]|uniref:helix-turn-helix domain-containing protein n=1 Tax=Eggerthella sinensis TaxID=242230 RepID=UPI0022E1208D|nr:helix-turn-helix transcriptional regulator [Eggerthella sinensis]
MDAVNPDIFDERQALGARIRQLRIDQGLTQRKLALMIGANHSTLGQIEAGKTNFMFDKLERIAEALGVEVRNLFEY